MPTIQKYISYAILLLEIIGSKAQINYLKAYQNKLLIKSFVVVPHRVSHSYRCATLSLEKIPNVENGSCALYLDQ